MANDTVMSLAPGARVEIRDEEWTVRAVKTASFGGEAVQVVGNSELVRGKEATFLSALDEIEELKPEDTELVADDSPRYRRSRLYLESLLRRTPPTDRAIRVGHRGAIRPAEYQLEPAYRALSQPRPRFLMADGVGMGKTIEVGVLLSELIRRGRGERILVVALKSILAQFQEELWARFTIPLVRLDSVGIQRVQTKIPSNMNPFYFYDRVIISVDTLKKDSKYRKYLEDSHWDVIVVDECQHIAVRTKGGSTQQSQRARLGQLLARTCDSMILTSATPHDGKAESFASLINLLEPTAIADESDYTSDEVRDFFSRRFKKDVAHEAQEEFHERRLEPVRISASPQENDAFRELRDIEFKTIGRTRNGKGVLFRTLLLKSFLSSPAACLSTIEERLKHKRVQDPDDPKAAADREALTGLKTLMEGVDHGDFTKYQELLQRLRSMGLDKRGADERVVVFSERIATLKYLRERLLKDLKLKDDAIAIFHGTLDDQKQQALVKSFGTEDSRIRVLLASDAAAEGINLHYYCHRLIHFDLPWSLITLEQRNGRIDRFGQKHQPQITYLLTVPGVEETKGDLQVLERLITKAEEVSKNLGDAAWQLNLHDAELEEEQIGKGMEEGKAPDEVIPDKPAHTDLLSALYGDDGSGRVDPEVEDAMSLFPNDLAYAREAFEQVLEDEPEGTVEWHDHLEGLTVRPSEDLLKRYDYLPLELRRTRDEIKLTADRQRVMDALDASRQDEKSWPEWELLWELHPVCKWLDDRVLSAFSRHEAPVLRLATGLAPGELALVFQGQVSNHRSQPAIVDWFAVMFQGGEPTGTRPLADLVESTGLDREPANPGGGLTSTVRDGLQRLIPPALEVAREHMATQRNDRAQIIAAPLRDGLRDLKSWRDRRLAMIQAKRDAAIEKHGKVRADQERRLSDDQAHVETVYKKRREWIEEGMRTVETPYLRLAAILIPQDA